MGLTSRNVSTSASNEGYYNSVNYLNRVRIRRLAEDLEQRGVRHEEESREHQPLLLQVAGERLLAGLQLPLEDRQRLPEILVTHTAVDHAGRLVRLVHDLLPGLVYLVEPLGLLGQLLGDVSAHKDGLQVDPEVLDQQPALEDLGGVGEVRDPLLYLLLEGCVVPIYIYIYYICFIPILLQYL